MATPETFIGDTMKVDQSETNFGAELKNFLGLLEKSEPEGSEMSELVFTDPQLLESARQISEKALKRIDINLVEVKNLKIRYNITHAWYGEKGWIDLDATIRRLNGDLTEMGYGIGIERTYSVIGKPYNLPEPFHTNVEFLIRGYKIENEGDRKILCDASEVGIDTIVDSTWDSASTYASGKSVLKTKEKEKLERAKKAWKEAGVVLLRLAELPYDEISEVEPVQDQFTQGEYFQWIDIQTAKRMTKKDLEALKKDDPRMFDKMKGYRELKPSKHDYAGLRLYIPYSRLGQKHLATVVFAMSLEKGKEGLVHKYDGTVI